MSSSLGSHLTGCPALSQGLLNCQACAGPVQHTYHFANSVPALCRIEDSQCAGGVEVNVPCKILVHMEVCPLLYD